MAGIVRLSGLNVNNIDYHLHFPRTLSAEAIINFLHDPRSGA
jgi:hypothetical protein